MPKKEKVLTVSEAQTLLEEIRTSCRAAVREESSADAGDFTIEALEKALGKDWQRTKIVVEVSWP